MPPTFIRRNCGKERHILKSIKYFKVFEILLSVLYVSQKLDILYFPQKLAKLNENFICLEAIVRAISSCLILLGLIRRQFEKVLQRIDPAKCLHRLPHKN